jgi:hypothetical protein
MLATVGVAAVWLSHPSVFLLFAGGTVLLWRFARSRRAIPLLSILVVWMVTQVLSYYLSLRYLSRNRYPREYWATSFAPVPIRSLSDLAWYVESLLGMTFMGFRQMVPPPPVTLPAWFDWENLILALAIILGAFWGRRICAHAFAVGSIAALANLAASAAHLYPLRNRPVLYLVPMAFLCAGWFVDGLAHRATSRPLLLSRIAAVVLLSVPLSLSADVALRPQTFSDIKSALRHVERRHAAGDGLSLNAWSIAPFRFYARFYQIGRVRLDPHPVIEDDPAAYIANVCARQGFGRNWVILVHAPAVSFVEAVRRVSPLLESWEGDQAGAYLFDHSHPRPCAPPTSGRDSSPSPMKVMFTSTRRPRRQSEVSS